MSLIIILDNTMKTYLLPIFALLIVSCGDSRPELTYDEMLNDVVLNFNIGTVGGDSVLKNFVKKAQADSVARQYSNPTMKEEMMFTLISDYIDAGQVDNAQHLYDNMLKYAEQEYGKVSQMTATTYKEKAHLYERVGDLENAIQMMQKSAEVFKNLPKNDINYYKDAEEFIRRCEEQKSKQAANNIISFFYEQPINKYTVSGIANENSEFKCYDLILTFHHIDTGQEFSVYGGRTSWGMKLDDNLAYPDNKDGDVIKSPEYDIPFFFADLDFDGKDELITDLSPYGGSQRNVGAFTSIYKIKNGNAIDATDYFTNKSEIFKSIDQYYFFVNNARKEIILYADGGAYSFGWEIYKFNNGEYIYDRYIHCDQNINSSGYTVIVLSPQGQPIKSFTVSEDKFNRDKWNY